MIDIKMKITEGNNKWAYCPNIDTWCHISDKYSKEDIVRSGGIKSFMLWRPEGRKLDSNGHYFDFDYTKKWIGDKL